MSDKVIECLQCGLPFFFTRKMRKTRKFCSRDCYVLSVQDFNRLPYPKTYYNGKREYLHRVIYCESKGVTIDSIKDKLIHHIDENPFNRNPDNLEIAENRIEHLRKHNFFRDKTRKDKEWQPIDGIPF